MSTPTASMLVLASALALGGSVYAGQSAEQSAAVSDHSVATNLEGVRAFLSPPADFNPLAASQAELDSYGIPPRPDAASAPEAYKAWAQAVTTATKTIMPELEETEIYHGPVGDLRAGAPSAEENATNVKSNNWSGIAIVDASNPFKVEEIAANFFVPIAQQAFGTCKASSLYGSAWVGIDGFNSNDVMQDGIEFDASCSGGVTKPFYAAWFEWFPFAETRINNFKIAPGDYMYVAVWNTSPTAAKASLMNLTTRSKTTISFNAPNGTKLEGNSAEWIVERPGVNGSLATLTNYIAEAFTNQIAWNYTSKSPRNYYPGKAPTGTIYNITMLDNASKPISTVTVGGTQDSWYFDEGSAL